MFTGEEAYNRPFSITINKTISYLNNMKWVDFKICSYSPPPPTVNVHHHTVKACSHIRCKTAWGNSQFLMNKLMEYEVATYCQKKKKCWGRRQHFHFVFATFNKSSLLFLRCHINMVYAHLLTQFIAPHTCTCACKQ